VQVLGDKFKPYGDFIKMAIFGVLQNSLNFKTEGMGKILQVVKRKLGGDENVSIVTYETDKPYNGCQMHLKNSITFTVRNFTLSLWAP